MYNSNQDIISYIITGPMAGDVLVNPDIEIEFSFLRSSLIQVTNKNPRKRPQKELVQTATKRKLLPECIVLD